MTVLSEINKITYIGSLAQTLYPIPFEYVNTDNIKVSVYTSNDEFVEDWTFSTQYVIEGGNVKVLPGYEIDDTKKLLVLRSLDIVQDNKYREGGDFPAKSTELSFDKLTMIAQQHQEVLDRCVKVEVVGKQKPKELLDEVYSKLDSATAIAEEAIAAADEATIAAERATTAVEATQKQLVQTKEYVDSAKVDIENTKNSAIESVNLSAENAKSDISKTVSDAKEEVNKTIDDAQMSLSDTITQATDDVRAAALEAAQGAINDAAAEATAIVIEYANNEVKPELVGYKDSASESATSATESARIARVWATGNDEEVQAIEGNEHSSRTYSNFCMALANAPEDVPVLESTLLATDVIKFNGGDIDGVINVINDSNHPIKVTGMAGTSATGYQIVDSNGLGDSDFEHYATGDRYGTRIANHNNTSNTTAYFDLYQSNVGKSVLDTTNVDTVLVPTTGVDDDSNRAASTAWVLALLREKGLI